MALDQQLVLTNNGADQQQYRTNRLTSIDPPSSNVNQNGSPRKEPLCLMHQKAAEIGLVIVRVNQTIAARIEEYANIPADIVEQHPSLVISPQFRRQGNGASVTEEVSISVPSRRPMRHRDLIVGGDEIFIISVTPHLEWCSGHHPIEDRFSL